MASKSAILAVRIIGDATGAKKAMDETATGAEKLQSGLSAAAGPAAAVGTALVGLGKVATDAASELQQSTGGVESVFQDQADSIIASAGAAADAVGLSTSSYENLAVILGSQLKNMGTPMDEVSGKTQDLIGLGSDLAATFGGTTADAVSAVSALLRGERDPIERYGVSIKQADINARMAAEGLTGLTGDQAKAAESQTVLAMLTEQTAAAQGQFARETDTAAGSTQIAQANFENAKAALGEGLLPVVSDAMTHFANLAKWVQQNSDTVTVALGVVGAFAGAILAANGAVKIYQGTQAAIKVATTVWTGAQWLLNAAMDANPVGLAIVAVGALVALFVTAYEKCEWFRDAIDNLVASVKNFFNQHAPSWLKSLLGLSEQVSTTQAPVSAQAVRSTASPVSLMTSPSLATLTTRAAQANAAPAASPTNITFQITGAVDPLGTAQQIKRILDQRDAIITGTVHL